MSVIWTDDGTDVAGDLSNWTVLGGTPVSSTAQAQAGSRSISCPTTGDGVKKTGVLADAGRRIRFWVFFSASRGEVDFVIGRQSGGGSRTFSLQCRPGGADTLQFIPGGGTQVNGTTVIGNNAWHRIVLSYTYTSSAVNEYRVYVDGVLDISISNQSGITGSGDEISWNGANGTGTFLDTFYIDDVSDLGDPDASAGASLTPTVGAEILAGVAPISVLGTLLTPITP